MKIYSYNPIHFEKWFWENIDRGIGGSETNAREWAWRLARRGHEVTVYAPVPWDRGERRWRDTAWCPLEEADFSQNGLWLLYRRPEDLDNFTDPHPDQDLWFVAQDEGDSYDWNEERIAKIDIILAFCPAHYDHLLSKWSTMRGKLELASNGLRMDLVREVERAAMEDESGPRKRNPKKLLYASSPDRGLRPLLSIFRRAKEWVPDLELVITYGFDNINKLEKLNPAAWRNQARERDYILKLADQPGIKFTGRISQRELYREWMTAGLWAYPTIFRETSCITCMEAQALGAIPITNPLWALASNVRHGVFIQGDPYTDGLVQARYAAEIIRLASDPELQEKIRSEMMLEARLTFNWERTVDVLESYMFGYWDKARNVGSQFSFQLKHVAQAQNGDGSPPRIINLGCSDDPAKLREYGAINVDVLNKHASLGHDLPVDVIHDVRQPLPFAAGSFDVAVVGDILEHMDYEDAVKVIANTKAVLSEKGRVVITCPDDHRSREEQNPYHGPMVDSYAEGVRGYHRPRSKEELLRAVKEAGLVPIVVEPIDYTFFEGWGVVAQ